MISSNKKNILIISPFIPFPLYSGGNVAQFSINDNLRHEHNLHLLVPIDKADDIENLKELQNKWENVSFYTFKETFLFKLKRFFFQKLPTLYSNYFAVKSLKKEDITKNDEGIFKSLNVFRISNLYVDSAFLALINEITILKSIDIIQVEFCDYLPLGAFLPSKVHKIFIHHELEFIRNERIFQLMEKTYSFIEYIKLKNRGIELSLLDAYDKVVTLSDVDKSILDSFSLEKKVVSSPVPLKLDSTSSSKVFTYNKTITFLGGEVHFPNKDGIMWFISEVWHELKRKYPDLKLRIIGSWSIETIKSFHSDSSIEFCGFVTDLATELNNTIFIVPIRIGSGIRMKILEAINLGCPIISTKIGIEGLNFVPGKDFLQANSPEEYSEKISFLIENPMLVTNIINSAKEVLLKKYSFDSLIQLRKSIYLYE